ncbi:hypothetical protein PENSPDRAFT_658836 [Peniophora sp. CONT]|nr:hypothetical protein PENSPDRAFT_658836 [Peniophora sp. CONT]
METMSFTASPDNGGFGLPPGWQASREFLRRLQADPKGVVEPFITMCRTRKPGDKQISPTNESELLDLADNIMSELMLPMVDIGRQTWQAIVNTGLVDLYQDLIVADGFFQGPVLWIDRILGGLTAFVVNAKGDRMTADKVLARTSELFNSVWKNRKHVRLWTKYDHMYGEKNKYMEPIVCLIWHYADLYNTRYGKKAGLDTFIPQVGLHCWVFVSGRDDLLDDHSLEPLRFLDSSNGRLKGKERDEFIKNAVLGPGGIGPDAVVLRLIRELERESVLAAEYQQTLGAILTLAYSPMLTPYFFEHQAHASLVKMVNRVVRGKEPYRERTKGWRAGYKFHNELYLYFISEVQTHRLKLRLRGEDVVSVMARGLDIVAEGLTRGSPVALENWDHLRSMLEELGTYKAIMKSAETSSGGGHDHRSKLVPGFRAGARADWWPSLQRLQTAAYKQGPGKRDETIATIMQEWTELGTVLGLSAEKERERHEREARHRCSWVACEKHGVEVPQGDLRTCAGCGETRYCSRPCQKSDWTQGGHKQRCKRLK